MPTEQLGKLTSMVADGTTEGLGVLFDRNRDSDDESELVDDISGEISVAESTLLHQPPVLRILVRHKDHPTMLWFDAVYIILEVTRKLCL